MVKGGGVGQIKKLILRGICLVIVAVYQGQQYQHQQKIAR
jgi:hypothetical protein